MKRNQALVQLKVKKYKINDTLKFYDLEESVFTGYEDFTEKYTPEKTTNDGFIRQLNDDDTIVVKDFYACFIGGVIGKEFSEGTNVFWFEKCNGSLEFFFDEYNKEKIIKDYESNGEELLYLFTADYSRDYEGECDVDYYFDLINFDEIIK